MMKFVKLLLVLALCSSASAYAAPTISVGPTVGLDIASEKITRTDYTSFRSGITGGLSANIVAAGFTFQPELIYVQKGFTVPTPYSGSAVESKFKYNYLDLPLLVKLHTEVKHFYLLVGPELGFKLNAKSETAAGTADVSNIHSFDLSIAGGVGYEYSLNEKTTVYFEVRNATGLTNVLQNSGETEEKNRAWFFLVGSHFDI